MSDSPTNEELRDMLHTVVQAVVDWTDVAGERTGPIVSPDGKFVLGLPVETWHQAEDMTRFTEDDAANANADAGLDDHGEPIEREVEFRDEDPDTEPPIIDSEED